MEQINIIGRLTRDIELKDAHGGFYVVSIAVNKKKDTAPVFYNGTINRDYGNKIAQYMTKGLQIFITGVPSINAWVDKATNEARGTINININSVQMLGGNKSETPNTVSVTPSVNDDIPF